MTRIAANSAYRLASKPKRCSEPSNTLVGTNSKSHSRSRSGIDRTPSDDRNRNMLRPTTTAATQPPSIATLRVAPDGVHECDSRSRLASLARTVTAGMLNEDARHHPSASSHGDASARVPTPVDHPVQALPEHVAIDETG